MFKNLREKSRTSPLLKPFYNNRYSWLAAACTAGIMLVVYFCYDLIPFGDTTILRMDLYHQYGPLFAELYERIKAEYPTCVLVATGEIDRQLNSVK